MDKERYQNSDVVIEFYPDGRIWLQNGIAGLWFDEKSLGDLTEMLYEILEKADN